MKVEQTYFVTYLIITKVPDPDLEIRWGGGGVVSEKNFYALRASVWCNNRGAGPPDPCPGSATVQYNCIIDYLRTRLLKFGQITFKW